ncbi:hypothetical protein V6N11_071721 [Hibiscus sabdariffa]|uniref:Uncharacterized protein n=1 Tax=Hibiscus sabdariffa TaxID=183260 RepID=A0ABR2U0X6_9ROSI
MQLVCPSSSTHTNGSHLWRALMKIWPLFHGFISWSIGDGNLVFFWHNIWIPQIDPLINWNATSITVNDNLLVCDMVSPIGEWNWLLLQHLLVPKAISFLFNIHFLGHTIEVDHLLSEHGLHLARANGFDKVQCQTHCAETLKLITSDEASYSPSLLSDPYQAFSLRHGVEAYLASDSHGPSYLMQQPLM